MSQLDMLDLAVASLHEPALSDADWRETSAP